MPSEVVSYEVGDNTVVRFEIEPPEGWHPAGTKEIVGRVQDAVRPAVEAAEAVLEQIARLQPAEVAVKFGIKVNGSASWLVAKTTAEASFEVTMTWKPGSGKTEAAAPAAVAPVPALAPAPAPED